MELKPGYGSKSVETKEEIFAISTVGRKPTISEEIIEKLCGQIAVGMPKSRAAPLSGISPRAFYNWMTKGNEILENIEKADEQKLDIIVTEQEFLYVQLVHNVEIAEAMIMREGIKSIKTEGPPGYKWLLAKRFRDEFGDSLEIRQPMPAEIQIKMPGILDKK